MSTMDVDGGNIGETSSIDESEVSKYNELDHLSVIKALQNDFDTAIYDTIGQTQNDEKNDVNASMEHLIIMGNYNRHQQWRVSEWERSNQCDGTNIFPHECTVNSKAIDAIYCNNGNIDSSPIRQRENDSTIHDACSKPKILHAQDARLYNPKNEKSDGFEPDTWPKLQSAANEASLCDRKWVEELSDQIHPIAFSATRLSYDVPPPSSCITYEMSKQSNECGIFPLCNCDFDMENTGNDIQQKDASRAMLLHCWERAVHASATAGVLQCHPSNEKESESFTRPSRKRTRDDVFMAYQNIRMEGQPKTIQFNGSSSGEINDILDPTHVGEFICGFCNIVFSNKDNWKDHVYGSNNAEGCCSLGIERKRREMVASVLETDVQTIIQQLLHLIILNPHTKKPAATEMNGIDTSSSRTLIDSFDILQIIRKNLTISRELMDNNSKYNKDVVLETLEVSCSEPPLPINAAVLEAVHYRLVDRYGKVPR